VYGWSGSPAIRVARPCSTVVMVAQVSGQSCGQAPRTTWVSRSAMGAAITALTAGHVREGDGERLRNSTFRASAGPRCGDRRVICSTASTYRLHPRVPANDRPHLVQPGDPLGRSVHPRRRPRVNALVSLHLDNNAGLDTRIEAPKFCPRSWCRVRGPWQPLNLPLEGECR
jgi:hypothetical protein